MEDKVASALVTLIRKNIKPNYPSTDGRSISIRCPYCGDSKRSDTSAHFYVYLDPPYGCHCFKCSTHVNSFNMELMKDLRLSDTGLAKELALVQRNYKFTANQTKNTLRFNENQLINPVLKGTNNEKIKLQYLNDRLGTNITMDECRTRYKVILNLKEFFKANEITEYTEDKSIIENLYRYCIGFISYDNNFIIFRSLNEKLTNFRYHNYRIFSNFDDSKKFYFIHSSVNILKNKINIIITEGILDIMGVFTHFYKDKIDESKDNYLFVSCNGKSFNLVFKYLARLGFLEQNIFIYSDNDVSLNFYRSLIDRNEVLKFANIKVYYNEITNSKGKSDFGVPKKQVKIKSAAI